MIYRCLLTALARRRWATKSVVGCCCCWSELPEKTKPDGLVAVKLMTGGAKFGMNGFGCWLLLNDSGVNWKLLLFVCMLAEFGVRV